MLLILKISGRPPSVILFASLGLLPLLPVAGAGIELYRGPAAVIVGGLTIGTLIVSVSLPGLLRSGENGSLPRPASVTIVL